MLDIYGYIKADHQKVAKLFKLFQSASTERNKLEIIDMIIKELFVHAESEANTFYRALEKHHQSKGLVLEGEEEHEKIKKMIKDLSHYEGMNAAIENKVMELKKLVDHHVSDEEGKMFRAAKKVFSDHEAWILKERMHAYKEKMQNSIKAKTEEVELA